LASRNELWQLLVTIILRKVKNTAHRHQAARRDHRREEHASGNAESFPPDWLLAQVRAADPTPADAVALTEEFEGRLQALSEPLQQIALWKLDGCTHEEIAAKLGCSKRTVIRRIEEIRSTWVDAADGPVES
jgi:DNA-directed RNA polymerase specialized sigma24 family protein